MKLIPFITATLLLFLTVLIIADHILKTCNKIIDRYVEKESGRWKFKADENYTDKWGANRAGVITDGKHYLYWHAFKENEKDSVETIHIYNSVFMTEDTEEIRFPWTRENEKHLLDALNRLPKESQDWYGDNSILHQIEFKSIQ